MSFRGQVAVVTGASSGIGWALAKGLAAEGCKVGLIARRRELLETLSDEIRQTGGTAASAVADVGDRAATLAAVGLVSDALGPVDLLIANAGVGMRTTLEPFNVEQIETMIRVNLFGVIYSIEAVLPEMLRRGRGHLAAISSLAAYRGLPGESGYCASKAAVNVYMEGLRIQLRKRGVAVSTICPGFVRTPMTDDLPFMQPWLMEPEEAARRILRALRRRCKVYNFPWQTTFLTKLSAWFPDRIMDRALGRLKPPDSEKPPVP